MSELYHITHSGDKGVNENFFDSAGMLMLGLVAGEWRARRRGELMLGLVAGDFRRLPRLGQPNWFTLAA